MKKRSLILSAAMAAIFTAGNVLAETSVNAAATSNYIWRGVTQSDDTASVSGGADWSHGSGVYAGIWSGSLVGGTETDLYAGFAGEAGGLGYDLGVITYQYSQAPDINFTEAYLSASFSVVSVGVSSTIDSAAGNTDSVFDEGDLYASASIDFALGDFDTSVYAGSYMFENDDLLGNTADYSHYGVSFTAGEVTIAFDKNDIEADTLTPGSEVDDNVRVVVTWSKTWSK